MGVPAIVRDELFDIIPKAEITRVFSYDRCELDAEFLGFTNVYKHLAAIIPPHCTVVDLGCYAAAQCYYFSRHRQYIGVDTFRGERFGTKNTIHYIESIQEFVANRLAGTDLSAAFAICSYVPDSDAVELVRRTFPNIYAYYPASLPCSVRAYRATPPPATD